MSGHSHARTILHKKQAADSKRGKIFSKLSREISMAAKERGGNPDTNPTLRVILQKAKEFNLPKDNIERAIKKGTGELKGEVLENILLEAYGPGGIALIVEGITDNKNRTLAEIKQILSQHQGKLTSPGSVKWMFERKVKPETGLLTWSAKEKVKLEEKDKQSCEKLFDALNENEAVQEIYYNINLCQEKT